MDYEVAVRITIQPTDKLLSCGSEYSHLHVLLTESSVCVSNEPSVLMGQMKLGGGRLRGIETL